MKFGTPPVQRALLPSKEKKKKKFDGSAESRWAHHRPGMFLSITSNTRTLEQTPHL